MFCCFSKIQINFFEISWNPSCVNKFHIRYLMLLIAFYLSGSLSYFFKITKIWKKVLEPKSVSCTVWQLAIFVILCNGWLSNLLNKDEHQWSLHQFPVLLQTTTNTCTTWLTLKLIDQIWPPQNDWPKFSVECKVPVSEFCACHHQGEIFWSRFVRDARVLGGPSNARITIRYVPFKKAMHWGAGSHKV